MRKHWEKLTLFLRVAGAPLENNICERALKKAVIHRKNSLFYKTDNGAAVGDLHMSLIQTCELNDINPFNYLKELHRHAEEASLTPEAWLPWNYRETLATATAQTAAIPPRLHLLSLSRLPVVTPHLAPRSPDYAAFLREIAGLPRGHCSSSQLLRA